MDFVAYCFPQLKLKYGTIKLYLCRVKYGYIIQGTASPFERNFLHRLHVALIGIKRIQGLQQNPKMLITGDILKKLCQSLESGYFDMYTNILMKAAVLLAYFGFIRCGEFTVPKTFSHDMHLTLGDISIYEGHLSVLLKQSKTDPFRKGVSLLIFQTGSCLCAYEVVIKYKKVRINQFPNSSGTNDPFSLLSMVNL